MLECVVPSRFFWNSTFLQFLSSLVVLWSPGVFPGGSKRCRAASKEVLGGQGKPRAPERWPESSGRGLDDFQFEAFLCQVWLFSVLLGRLHVAPGKVELRPWRSQGVKGSLELQNGSLRALEEAWITTFSLRQFPVKSGCFSVLLERLQVARGDVELRPRRSQEVRGSPELQNGGLRALGEAWMATF